MKRSELKFTGEQFDLTPDSYGETAIITDEILACVEIAQLFGIDEYDFDDESRRDEVELATDSDGNYYAVLVPFEQTSWGHRTGIWNNKNLFKKCANPSDAKNGLLEISSGKWEMFDDESES